MVTVNWLPKPVMVPWNSERLFATRVALICIRSVRLQQSATVFRAQLDVDPLAHLTRSLSHSSDLCRLSRGPCCHPIAGSCCLANLLLDLRGIPRKLPRHLVQLVAKPGLALGHQLLELGKPN